MYASACLLDAVCIVSIIEYVYLAFCMTAEEPESGALSLEGNTVQLKNKPIVRRWWAGRVFESP
jgi:hypothetical protein